MRMVETEAHVTSKDDAPAPTTFDVAPADHSKHRRSAVDRAVDRAVSLIARRPCCVAWCSMGISFVCLAIFAVGMIVGFIPARIDFSPDSMRVTNDEVADRSPALSAALQRTSRFSPSRLITERVTESSPPPDPPSPPMPSAPPVPMQPPPPADEVEYTTHYSFEELSYLAVYFQLKGADGPADGLLDAAVLRRMKSLQDALFTLPHLHALCRRDGHLGTPNGTRPEANCTEPYGMLRLLYSDLEHVERYQDISILVPAPLLPNVSIALPAAVAASLVGTRVSTSALSAQMSLNQMSLSDVGAPASVSQLLGRTGVTCATFVVASGALRATDCGPVTDCCGCGDDADAPDSSCVSAPLCKLSSDQGRLEYRGGPAIDDDEAPLSGSDVASTLSAEMSCEDTAVRRSVGWSTPKAYREGNTTKLTMLRSHMQLGSYRRQHQTFDEYQEVVEANWATLAPLMTTKVVPLVASFNEDERNIALGLSASAWSRTDIMVSFEIISHMLSSAVWAGAGYVTSAVYLITHLRSPLLAGGGLFAVGLAFPLTWFVYTAILRQELMGFFNFMATFILVGIGVDDIFVFSDAWEQSRHVGTTLEERMHYTYRRAIKAMAITTVTDAAVFYANIISVIPVVRLFGIFMGSAVCINFLFVCTWYPALVAIRFRAGLDRTGRCCVPCSTFCGCKRPVTGGRAASDAAATTSAEKASPGPDGRLKIPTSLGLEAFFSGPYLRTLTKLRWPVYAFAVALAAGSAYSISLMQPTDRDFRQDTFHADSNIQRILEQIDSYGDDGTTIRVVWGVQGLDRLDTDANDPYAGGNPIWTESFAPHTAAAQRAVLGLCSSIRSDATELLKADGTHKCFMEHYADWLVELRGDSGFPASEAQFETLLDRFALFSKHRQGGNTTCGWLANEVLSTTRGEAEYGSSDNMEGLEEQCLAFWAVAPSYQEDAAEPGTLPSWHNEIIWTCPINEEQRSCWSTEEASDRSHWDGFSASLRGFVVKFEIAMTPWTSGSDMRPVFDSFERIVTSANAGTGAGFTAMQTTGTWQKMRLEELMIQNGLMGCAIGLGCAGLALIIFLQNWLISLLSVLNVGMVALCSLASMVWMGWKFGFIEAVCLTVVMGFSIDFVAHMAIAYNESRAPTRYERTQQAIGELGVSVWAGAISTIIATAFMSQAKMTPFRRLGLFMLVNIVFSCFFALVVFPATLVLCGPQGGTGDLCRRRDAPPTADAPTDQTSKPSSKPSSRATRTAVPV